MSALATMEQVEGPKCNCSTSSSARTSGWDGFSSGFVSSGAASGGDSDSRMADAGAGGGEAKEHLPQARVWVRELFFLYLICIQAGHVAVFNVHVPLDATSVTAAASKSDASGGGNGARGVSRSIPHGLDHDELFLTQPCGLHVDFRGHSSVLVHPIAGRDVVARTKDGSREAAW